MYGGGAPFNVAVNAKRAGAKAGFVGRVGRDLVGTFLKKFAAGAGLERCEIQTDAERNTTLAFVTLKEGEREFAFFRHDTADFHIDEREMNWEQYEDLNIVHLGSLMLSEREGREFASSMVKKIRKSGKVFASTSIFAWFIRRYRGGEEGLCAVYRRSGHPQILRGRAGGVYGKRKL